MKVFNIRKIRKSTIKLASKFLQVGQHQEEETAKEDDQANVVNTSCEDATVDSSSSTNSSSSFWNNNDSCCSLTTLFLLDDDDEYNEEYDYEFAFQEIDEDGHYGAHSDNPFHLDTTTSSTTSTSSRSVHTPPTRRFKLSRRVNWKFVSPSQLIIWQEAKERCTSHRVALHAQKQTLRTLRYTGKLLHLPLRRCYVSMDEADSDQIMFSAIHEEICSDVDEYAQENDNDNVFDQDAQVTTKEDASSHGSGSMTSSLEDPQDVTTTTIIQSSTVINGSESNGDDLALSKSAAALLRWVQPKSGIDAIWEAWKDSAITTMDCR